MTYQMDQIMTRWGEILAHPTERHRPHPSNGKQGLSFEEIAYTLALNIGKRVFLNRVGNKLKEDYPTITTKVESDGGNLSLLGYRLVIPGSIIPPRRKIGLAYIGNYDHNLEIHANNPIIIELIKKLASTFEKEVLGIETKLSEQEPHKVYARSNDRGCLAPSQKVDKYLSK